jgi:hypothetical protein
MRKALERLRIALSAVSIVHTGNNVILGVHFVGLLDVHDILSADTGISRQTENHSFGDHLISGSVSVTPSSVIEAFIMVWSMSL